MRNDLIKVRDDHSKATAVREMASMLLGQLNTAGGKELMGREAETFLLEHSTHYLQIYMGNLRQRDLGGDHLWIRGHTDCLTVSQGPIGPVIDGVEGEWTDEEKKMALYLYQFTEAAKR